LDDDALLARARNFEHAALASIFDRYYGALYRYLYLHSGHTETAEDLSAQVFRRLLDTLRAGAGPEHFLKAWLFRVASNLLIDDARRAHHRDHLPLEDTLQAPLHELGVSLEDAAHDSLLRVQLRLALDELTSSQRSVIILRYLLEMPNEEVAQIMEMTIGAVKAQQHRGLASLRRKLNDNMRMHDLGTEDSHESSN
jgi:RNA polymerase sigma-70 factor, ECF subfamily